jgi:hypothetical protein
MRGTDCLNHDSHRKYTLPVITLLCCALLSLVTVFMQVRTLGWAYLESGQNVRHTDILEGRAGSPYQYRLLSEVAAQGLIGLAGALGSLHPVGTGFVAFRVLQNFVLFWLAALYYDRLGLGLASRTLAISILAWGMTQSLYDSDLAFSTYSDVAFYLAGGLLVLADRIRWLVPLVILAALNRETSGLLALLAVGARPPGNPVSGWSADRRLLHTTMAGLLAFAAVFFGLRILYGWRSFVEPYGISFGVEMIAYNLRQYRTWVHGFATLGLVPLVALASWSAWPATLRRFFWIVVPAWFTIHCVGSVLAESRVLLVPQALIFIPAAAFAAGGGAAGAESGPGTARARMA